MGKIGNTWGRKMKEMVKKGQKINLINCEKVQGSEAFHNYSSEMRCSIPVKVKFLEKKPQIVNIHRTETVVRIRHTK
jgi:hypothetical protein